MDRRSSFSAHRLLIDIYCECYVLVFSYGIQHREVCLFVALERSTAHKPVDAENRLKVVEGGQISSQEVPRPRKERFLLGNNF